MKDLIFTQTVILTAVKVTGRGIKKNNRKVMLLVPSNNYQYITDIFKFRFIYNLQLF